MNAYNEQGEKHGYWETCYSNGNLEYKGSYVNGKLHGLQEGYYSKGKPWYKVNYIHGNEHGLFEYYNEDDGLYLKEYYL